MEGKASSHLEVAYYDALANLIENAWTLNREFKVNVLDETSTTALLDRLRKTLYDTLMPILLSQQGHPANQKVAMNHWATLVFGATLSSYCPIFRHFLGRLLLPTGRESYDSWLWDKKRSDVWAKYSYDYVCRIAATLLCFFDEDSGPTSSHAAWAYDILAYVNGTMAAKPVVNTTSTSEALEVRIILGPNTSVVSRVFKAC